MTNHEDKPLGPTVEEIDWTGSARNVGRHEHKSSRPERFTAAKIDKAIFSAELYLHWYREGGQRPFTSENPPHVGSFKITEHGILYVYAYSKDTHAKELDWRFVAPDAQEYMSTHIDMAKSVSSRTIKCGFCDKEQPEAGHFCTGRGYV